MLPLMPVFPPSKHINTNNTHITGNTRTRQRFGSINPNFKSSAFRPARITDTNLGALTPLFPHLFAFYPLPLCLPSPSTPSISLFISCYLCLPPPLFHNSLSHCNSLYSINSFSPYFIVSSLRGLLLTNHSSYLSLSVKVSACYRCPPPPIVLLSAKICENTNLFF